MYKSVLLKLSGEALGSEKEVFDIDTLNSLAATIKELVSLKIRLGVVVGGGNFVRGRTLQNVGFDRVKADYMGMMGTIMNAIALETTLNNHGIKAKALSALDLEIVEKYEVERSRHYLDEGYVVIFAGGVGSPYFSTDTCAALRASENKLEVILLAKNGVDGVYDDDPSLNPAAKRYDELTYDTILEKGLKVIDSTAASMCKDNHIESLVFDMKKEGNIKKAVLKENIGTVIKI